MVQDTEFVKIYNSDILPSFVNLDATGNDEVEKYQKGDPEGDTDVEEHDILKDIFIEIHW